MKLYILLFGTDDLKEAKPHQIPSRLAAGKDRQKQGLQSGLAAYGMYATS